jgi:D-galactose 1-dehydrogenase
VVSRRAIGPEGVPAFTSLEAMIESGLAVDAVALCNRPGERVAAAKQALAAGLHVFLEKPPAVTMDEAQDLVAFARAQGVTLFASWHARANQAVEDARTILSTRTITGFHINWLEDVNKWHPGQTWIWEQGGFGVFDPGINALSILTHILPSRVSVDSAELITPDGAAMPIRAALTMTGEVSGTAVFDWRPRTDECWTIDIDTREGHVGLDHGGRRLLLGGVVSHDGADEEYRRLYAQFASLVAAGRSDVDLEPLRLVEEAFAVSLV